jgi:DNA-binding Lrp family transcriptional regulator
MLELTREQLWQWYVVEKKTSVEIANEVGLRPNTVRARLLKAGIPVRSRGEAQVLAVSDQEVDAEALATMYQCGSSPQQLAEHFGTTRSRILAQLRRQGIYEENRIYSGDRHWNTGMKQSEEHVRKRQEAKARSGSRNGPVPVPIEERFWPYVEKTDGCWLWKGGADGMTYGRIYDVAHKEKVLAHRVSWEIHHGAIPEGQNVLHRCDNPACVNPAHLFLGTHADNSRDMVAKFRARNSVFADDDVRFIRKARHCDSHSVAELAQILGVTTVTIYNVVNRRTHQHIADELAPPSTRTFELMPAR